jgi:hypothetical protein
MALPALELHDTLHRFAIHDVAGHAQSSPYHPVTQIWLVVDESLDPLREQLVDDHRSLAMPVV